MRETLHIDPQYEALLRRHGLCEMDAFFAWRRGDRLDKAGLETWRQRWRLILPGTDGTSQTFYLKRFERPPWRRQLERWRSGCGAASTAGVEWNNACLLADAGISAARAVAYGEQCGGMLERRSFVLLSRVIGVSLEKWVAQNLAPTEPESQRVRRFRRVDRLARFVARFHAAGFVHRDLYLSHIFLDESAAGAAGEFALIDLQRVFRPRWRARRWVIKDLAALNVSTPADRVGVRERLRFISRYVRECSRFGDARSLIAPVAQKSAVMAARIARRASLQKDH